MIIRFLSHLWPSILQLVLLFLVLQEYMASYSGNLGGIYVKNSYSFGFAHIILVPLLLITQITLLSIVINTNSLFLFYKMLYFFYFGAYFLNAFTLKLDLPLFNIFTGFLFVSCPLIIFFFDFKKYLRVLTKR